jgi:GT2 family glycosyltransferase
LKCPNGFENPKCLENISIEIVNKAIQEFEEKYKNKRVNLKNDNPLISIIIPVLNQFKYLLTTINSILNSTKENIEIIIVDNNSDNEVKEYLKGLKRFKMIKIITNEKNLGFGKANNQGVKIAEGKYICLLNSDIKVGEGWLNTLVNGFDNKTGITGASGGYLDRDCKCVGITRNENDRYDYLEGWCLLICRDLYNQLGGFDERFECFSEDADLSFRFRRAGYKTKLVSGVNIHHFANKTVFSQTDFNVEEVSKRSSAFLKEKLKEKTNAKKLCTA